MFWIITVCLFVIAVLFVLAPLWSHRKVDTFETEELRKTANIALFHERTNDLESQLATGEIDKEQFEHLLRELQQNLLADVSDEEKDEIARKRFEQGKSDVATTGKGRFGYTFLVPGILALLVPVSAYLLYEHWGYFDDVELMDYFERTVNNEGDPQEAQALIVALGEAVQANEDLPWGWYFLGENFANIGMFNEAQIAYQRSADLLPDTGDKALVLGRVALAMYVNSDLEMTPEIESVIAEARRINPNEISVLQLLAANAEQNQDWESAIDYWRLLIQQNPNSPEAQELRRNIATAQQLLSGDEPAAAGPVVMLSLSLDPALDLDGNLAVFVAARNAEREGMPPLAATRLTVSDLPTTIRLDNSSAVGPFNLGSAESVTISALVSRNGVATPSAGDYRILSDAIELGAEPVSIELVISDQVE